MLEANTPLSIWIQIMSFCFFSAGLFTDLMMVRTCLCSAYVFLMINALVGSPLWPDWSKPGFVQADGIFWASLNLWVHASSLTRLWLDECRAPPQGEHLESLWRLFYRTGGVSHKVFVRSIAKHVKVVEFKEDQIIPHEENFYIIYQGTVELTAIAPGRRSASFTMASGQMFDFRLLNLLHDVEGSDQSRLHEARATSRSVTLFSIPKKALPGITRGHKTILLQLLTEDFAKNYKEESKADLNTPPLADYIHVKFGPLRHWEQPDPLAAGSGEAARTPLRHVLRTMGLSWNPPWPIGGHLVGLRHRLAAPTRDASEMPTKLLDMKGSKEHLLFQQRWGSTTSETLAEEDEEVGST